ncbi:MAG: Amidase [Pseudonocardiales bacterium]|nr:Amidase [Pseudonocardiales bacterium]
MTGRHDLLAWTAGSLAEGVRAGAFTARAVLDRHHERADQGADLNALVATDWDRAEQQAAAIDALPTADRASLPLAGVPFTVKDVLCVAGLPATAGSRAWSTNRPADDAAAVAHARAAGAIVIGKTNCPEFAFGTTTTSDLFGTTHNPLDPTRTPGGSSGGEAAAVAAGISAFGLGTDFGGSLRWPAQCTGITALRPTPGRVPGTGQLPGVGGNLGQDGPVVPSPAGSQGFWQVVGPLARDLEDLELILLAIARPDQIDPRVPERWDSRGESTSSLRVAWTDGSSIGPVRREVAALMRRCADAFAGSGHSTSELGDPLAGCLDAYNHLRDLDPLPDHLAAVAGHEDQLEPGSLAALRGSTTPDGSSLITAWRDALRLRARALRVFRDNDVLLLPVAGGPAGDRHGVVDIDGVSVGGWSLMAHCRSVTLLGAPVVSLPVGTSAEGLPLSVQVIAAPWQERKALTAARVLRDNGLGFPGNGGRT